MYGQYGINEKHPNKAADLTLGSTDKGLLLNRVSLVDRNSTKPLSTNDLPVGMVVYNINETSELSEGLYFWSSDKKWNKLFMKTVPTRQSNYIGFLESQKSYALSASKSVNISDLNYTYNAKEDGTVFLDYIVYARVANAQVNPKLAVATKTVFTSTVTGSTNNLIFQGNVAISPMRVISIEGSNSVAGKGSFFFDVKAGESYTIKLDATDYYNGKAKNDTNISVGDFKWGDYKAHSSLKMTFLSKPNM
jgi:hypothetical protein